jgi:hypothetical protein
MPATPQLVPLVSIDCTGHSSVALLRGRDGQAQLLTFDGQPSLPSGVYAGAGSLLTGRAALDAAAIHGLHRYVATPLRHLGAAPRPVAGRDPVAIVTALLTRIQVRATQAAGDAVTTAVIAVPPGWGPQRRGRLRHAAHDAGFGQVHLVDAAAAIAHQHLAESGTGVTPTVLLVCQVNATATTTTVLRGTSAELETIATLTTDSGDAGDQDVDSLDPRVAIARTVDLTQAAVRAAEIGGPGVITTVLHAPDDHLPALAAAMRTLGLVPRSASDTDTVRGALIVTADATAVAPTRRRRVGRGHHGIATTLPLPVAAALLALLPRTGVAWPGPQHPRAPYLYTYWPAWGLVVLLIHVGVLALVLVVADRSDPAPGTENQRRRGLARGLYGTAVVTLTAAVATAAVAGSTYRQVPVWYLLGWSVGPGVVLAAATAIVAAVVTRGHTSALRWQIWLRLPSLSLVLVASGIIIVEVNLATHPDAASYLDSSRSLGLAQVGTLAIALAVLPLVLHRIDHQLFAAPFVIGPVLWTHSYTTTNTVVGMYLVACVAWWVTRIRPAGAYTNPHHPATRLALSLEAENPAIGPTMLPGG